MKIVAFLLAVLGGLMIYLGITGKKLTVGKWTFGGGFKTNSSPSPSSNVNKNISPVLPSTPTIPDTKLFFGSTDMFSGKIVY